MAVMQTVGPRRPPAHANVAEDGHQYVVSLDVADFTESELKVEVAGRTVRVHGEQEEMAEDRGSPLRLRETLEESFRLPDDADPDGIDVEFAHGTLEIRIPRANLEPRRLAIRRHVSGAADATAC